uniref:39S ribosomal protein L50, mitochondrial n=1 Tax=Acrobeloides nanus TaxID=290746 RepID=A0A914CG11_9BILA
MAPVKRPQSPHFITFEEVENRLTAQELTQPPLNKDYVVKKPNLPGNFKKRQRVDQYQYVKERLFGLIIETQQKLNNAFDDQAVNAALQDFHEKKDSWLVCVRHYNPNEIDYLFTNIVPADPKPLLKKGPKHMKYVPIEDPKLQEHFQNTDFDLPDDPEIDLITLYNKN